MGRGLASKGKRDMSGPSWLNPNGEGEGDGGGVRVEREDKPRRRPKDDEDDLDVKKTGIQWKPLAFLLLMILPGLAPVLLDVFDKLQGAHASPYHTQHTHHKFLSAHTCLASYCAIRKRSSRHA